MTKGKKMNTVLSDMAPNMSGQLSVDQPKSMYLAELSLDMAIKTLMPNGHFVVKVFRESVLTPMFKLHGKLLRR